MKTVTLELPDDLAELLAEPGQDLSRSALEALGIEAYRAHRITGFQLRQLLGIEDRFEMDAFLKARKVWLDYTMEDFRREREATREIMEQRRKETTSQVDR